MRRSKAIWRRTSWAPPYDLGDPDPPPLILPGQERARWIRRLRGLVGLALITAMIGWVAWNLRPAEQGDPGAATSGTDGPPPTERAPPPAEEVERRAADQDEPLAAAPAAGDAPTGRGMPPEAPAAPSEAPATRSTSGFGGLADSLHASIDGYRQRHSDFERGRIGCDLLTVGYVRVGDVVMELARVPAARGGIAEADEAEAFRALMQEAAEVDRLFEGSGCPRP